MAMRTLTSAEAKVKSYKIHLMEMVINAIYYNPVYQTCPRVGGIN
jgi:importin-7